MEPKKRSLGAEERDEFLRAAWRALVAGEAGIDAGRLVFVDEMGTNVSLAPLYAWSRRGARAFGGAPRNWGKNITLLSSITAEGLGGSRSVSRGGRLNDQGGLRDLLGVCPGSVAFARTGGGDGQPLVA
jgi:hypothetical protein